MIDLSTIDVSAFPHWLSPGGEVLLINADCMAVLPLLEAGSVDAVITSPPYNLGGQPWKALGHWRHGHKCSGGEGKWKRGAANSARGVDYGSHSDSMPWKEYVEWQHEVISALWSAISANGVIFFNHKPRVVGDRLWLPLELIPDGVLLRQIIIWDRGGGINYTSTALVPVHEWVMILAKPEFRLRSQGVSGFGDVWRMQTDENEHPAPFPYSLPYRCLETVDAETILDPFAGSFTTAVACIRTQRQCIAIEIDPKYFAIGKRRCEEALAIGSLFDPVAMAAPDLFSEVTP